MPASYFLSKRELYFLVIAKQSFACEAKPGRVLHVLSLDQLVAEIESRGDVTLHEVEELLGLVADRQWRGAQPFLQEFKIPHAPYGAARAFSVRVERIFSADGLASAICKLPCYLFSGLPFERLGQSFA
jgi:hypothetical protein